MYKIQKGISTRIKIIEECTSDCLSTGLSLPGINTTRVDK
jgi:hypothetical protein